MWKQEEEVSRLGPGGNPGARKQVSGLGKVPTEIGIQSMFEGCFHNQVQGSGIGLAGGKSGQ